MLSLAFALLLSAAAPDSSSTPVPTTESAKPPKRPKICREDEHTGSRMRKKICKTQEEWNNQDSNFRGDVRFKGGN